MPTAENFKADGQKLAILAAVLTPVALVLVVLRLIARKNQKKPFGLDDYFICAAMGGALTMGALTMESVYWGYGRPVKTLVTNDVQHALLYFWTTQIMYKAIMMCTKLSMLCMYLRFFDQQRWFRLADYGLASFVVLYAVASIVATVFQCTPVKKAWNKQLHGHCINMTAFWFSNSVASVASDLLIISLPMYPVWKLQMAKRAKLLLVGVFMVGGIVIIASVLRMTTLETGSKAPDLTHGSLPSTCWTTIEACVGIIGACLPMLKGPVQKCCPRVLPLSAGSGSGGDSRKNISTMPPPGGPGRRSYHDLDGNNKRFHVRRGGPESMLEAGVDYPMGKITKQTDVDIDISDMYSTSS